MLSLLVSINLLPIAGALLVLVFRNRGIQAWAALVAFATLVLSLAAIGLVYPERTAYLFGQMPWIMGLRTVDLFGVALDPLSSIMLLMITLIGFLVVLFSTEYMSKHNREHAQESGQARYYFWLLMFIGSMTGVALAPNLLQLFVFWELTTLCSWALISHSQEEKALRAGFKALIMTHVGGLFFMAALFVLFILTRSFEFQALEDLSDQMRVVVFLLLLVAAWAKAAQIPFYTWLPDAMEAPTPISAYLHAAAMVKAGVYLIARVSSASWSLSPGMGLLVAIGAAITMMVAILFYFTQDDLKKLLAYSTIVHLGYVLMGLGLGIMGSEAAFRGALLHIVCHGFGKTLLFLAVGSVAYATGSRSIKQLSGLSGRMPVVAVSFIVGVFAVTGLPPFAAFFSKFFLFVGAMDLGGWVGTLFGVFVLLESLASFFWFLQVTQWVFFGEPSEITKDCHDPPPVMIFVLIVLMIGCLAAPFIALPLVNLVPTGM